jgi:hypothetical protein
MSPTEIPGTSLKFLNKMGKKKCPKCKQEYRIAKLKLKDGIIYKLCPNPKCHRILAQYTYKEVVKMALRQGK